MEKKIFWRFILNTSNKEKAEPIKSMLLNIINNSELVKYEKYYKDETLYLLEISQKIEIITKKDILFEVFKFMTHISNTWFVNTSYNEYLDEIDFSGISEKNIKITGLKWANLTLE